jgi:hypothetical protein
MKPIAEHTRLTCRVACAVHRPAPVSLARCARLAWAAGCIPKVAGSSAAAAQQSGASVEFTKLNRWIGVRGQPTTQRCRGANMGGGL